MARPKKYEIDTKQLTTLAKLGCTNIEMADFFGCSPDLLEKSYSEFLTKGRTMGKMRLRQIQWKIAENGNCTMAIWLGKNMLGQSDGGNIADDNQPLPFSVD